MRWFVIGLFILALGGAVYWWRPWIGQGSTAKLRAESTVQPENRKIATIVSATGSLRLRSGAEVRVGAQLSGIVTKLNVTIGSHVHENDVVAVIDSRGIDAKISQARAQVDYDRISLEKTRRELARSEQLLAAGLIPRQQAEELREDYRVAQAKVTKSERDLDVAQSDLPYAAVRAPISGTISAISTQQGETIAASFAAPTFVTIIKDDALELVAMVDETDIGGVRPGDPVTFTVQSYPDREYAGRVVRIAPTGSIISGVVNYEVGIQLSHESSLKPDMTANIAITTARRNALMVPTRAIEKSADRAYVYIDSSGSLQKRPITPGASDGPFTEVRSGLAQTDLVALVAQPGDLKRSNP